MGVLCRLPALYPVRGTLFAVAFPAVVAFAVDPSRWMLDSVLVLYFGMELVTTNAIEPRLYGSSTGLSALAVLVAAIFWARLWGPIGLILAPPTTTPWCCPPCAAPRRT